MDKHTCDKIKLIASLVVIMEPGATHERYFELAEPLWPLDIPDILAISEEVMRLQFAAASSRFVLLSRMGLMR